MQIQKSQGTLWTVREPFWKQTDALRMQNNGTDSIQNGDAVSAMK